jgi:hypothetical protein
MNSLTKNCLLQHVLCLEQQLSSLRAMIMIASQGESEPVETVSKKAEPANDYLTEELEDRFDVYLKGLSPQEAEHVLG